MRPAGRSMTVISLILAAVGAFMLVAGGQLILGLSAAAVAALFITGRGGR